MTIKLEDINSEAEFHALNDEDKAEFTRLANMRLANSVRDLVNCDPLIEMFNDEPLAFFKEGLNLFGENDAQLAAFCAVVCAAHQMDLLQ